MMNAEKTDRTRVVDILTRSFDNNKSANWVINGRKKESESTPD